MIENPDLNKLLEKLPSSVKNYVNQHPQKNKITEIIIDLGRRPEARFPTGPEFLSQKIISWQDINHLTKQISKFSSENRAGIELTLHRISCIRNRQFLIVGLTCRIGRVVLDSICIIRDLLESEKSVLILGKPGVGKTTIIREIARILSDEMRKRVVIIDTSNEIAGDSDIPHFAIGKARRMQVSQSNRQHQVMVEAVENHMPQVIIIDEIGTELEALAACTIAEKGVQLIGTTHGNYLENLIKNPPLSTLIGGIQYVTLSDEEAKRRKTQKSILERKAYPTFPLAIEINEQNSWTIHENVQESIDSLLCEKFLIVQRRTYSKSEKGMIRFDHFHTNQLIKKVKLNHLTKISRTQTWDFQNINYNKKFTTLTPPRLKIYIYALSPNLIREVLSKLNLHIIVTKKIKRSNAIIGLKSYLKKNRKLQKLAKDRKIPVYKINRNTVYQVIKLIQFIML